MQYQVCDHGVVPQPALFVQAHSARQDNILRVIHEEAVVQTVDVVPLKGSHILQRFNPAVYIVIALGILRRPGCHLLLQPGLGGGIGSAIEQSKAVQQLRNLCLQTPIALHLSRIIFIILHIRGARGIENILTDGCDTLLVMRILCQYEGLPRLKGAAVDAHQPAGSLHSSREGVPHVELYHSAVCFILPGIYNIYLAPPALGQSQSESVLRIYIGKIGKQVDLPLPGPLEDVHGQLRHILGGQRGQCKGVGLPRRPVGAVQIVQADAPQLLGIRPAGNLDVPLLVPLGDGKAHPLPVVGDAGAQPFLICLRLTESHRAEGKPHGKTLRPLIERYVQGQRVLQQNVTGQEKGVTLPGSPLGLIKGLDYIWVF